MWVNDSNEEIKKYLIKQLEDAIKKGDDKEMKKVVKEMASFRLS